MCAIKTKDLVYKAVLSALIVWSSTDLNPTNYLLDLCLNTITYFRFTYHFYK